ncbi:MAG: type IV secretion system protein B4, partial [Limimaricola soesokkakensis]
MPRDDARGAALDARTMTPDWYARETRLAHMLPYVSLVDDQTVRTRVNELFRCIRLEGINSYTTDDAYLDKVTALFARIVAQLGPEFSYYVHKVSKAIKPDLDPIREDSFAGEVDRRWRAKLETSGLRDKTLTLTVIHRPPPKSLLPFLSRSAPDRLKEETRKRLQRLGEAVNVFLSGLTELKPRLLS